MVTGRLSVTDERFFHVFRQAKKGAADMYEQVMDNISGTRTEKKTKTGRMPEQEGKQNGNSWMD